MAILTYRVYLPSDVLEELGAHTGHLWSDPLLEPIIADAIRAWMHPAPTAQRQQQRQQQPVPIEAGYQWKQLFLPEGTRLRASFGGIAHFAVVEGADIVYDGDAISPSGLANLHGSGNRNAWKAVWLRFPGTEQWLLADVCRSMQEAAIARLFGGDAQTSHPPAPTRPAAASGEQRAAQPPSAPRKNESRPSSGAASAHGNGIARKSGAEKSGAEKNGGGRSSRRRRHAKKNVPGHS